MMNVDFINHNRLASWEKQLNDAHATAVVLIGVGHDHVSGQIHCVITEDMTEDNVYVFISKAMKHLEFNSVWKKANKEILTEDSGEVIAFHPAWIDKDFNPDGIRSGFVLDENFISAKWEEACESYVNDADHFPTHFILQPKRPK